MSGKDCEHEYGSVYIGCKIESPSGTTELPDFTICPRCGERVELTPTEVAANVAIIDGLQVAHRLDNA